MTAAAKLQGTCSVCLRVIQLRGDRPIRHGFSAVGVRHGQSGGYHTGPCQGTRFPHLGISEEGTRWALERDRDYLIRTREHIETLKARPDLTWYPKKYDVKGGRSDLSRPVVIKPGTPADYSNGAPDYEYLLKSRIAEQESHARQAESAIDAYDRVLANWSPGKYPTSPAPGKVETVHMATPRRNSRGETWTGISCRFTRQGWASDKQPKTSDPAEVTCKRCRAALGLPPL